MGGVESQFSVENYTFPPSISIYVPKIRKPANKEANNYQEERRDYRKKSLANRKELWNDMK